MKKLVIPLLLAVVLVLVGFRLWEELQPASSARTGGGPPAAPLMLVETAEVTPQLFTTDLTILGELRPLASVDVMSKIGGRLESVQVERGDPVTKGQLLVVVDDEDLLQQIRRAEATIAVARAGVNREVASFENLEIQLRRYRQLHEDGLFSTHELEDIASRVRAARAAVELSQAQVDQAEASLRELKLQQEQTRVYSPLDGFVGTRYLDPGSLVNPNVPIVSVIDVSRVKTVVPIMESLLRDVPVGLAATVTVDAYPGSTYSGRITRISPFLNPETRSADVEIEIANPNRQLKPGMFARVSIEAKQASRVLAVPRAALLTRGNEKGVFLLSEDQTTIYRPIHIGRIQGDFVEVLDGLQEGTQVVTTGAQKLNEGDKVRIG